MVRLAIIPAAGEAICSTLPQGAPPWPVQRQGGQCLITSKQPWSTAWRPCADWRRSESFAIPVAVSKPPRENGAEHVRIVVRPGSKTRVGRRGLPAARRTEDAEVARVPRERRDRRRADETLC